MTRFLSEPEAWREIAERVDRLISHEGYLCDQVGYLAGRWGAEFPPFNYADDVTIALDVETRMLARIKGYLNGERSAFDDYATYDKHHPTLAEYRKSRVIASLWLALEAEDELKASKRRAA